MNMKKCFLAGLAGFVGMYALSFLWYMVIMKNFYATEGAAVMRTEFNMLFITLGYVVISFIMAYMYPTGYKGGTPAKEGVRFGILVGLLVWLTSNLILHGVYNTSATSLSVDSLYHIVEQGVGGLLIGLVYGKSSA